MGALAILEMMRPKQWTKNLLVFAALIFTGNILNVQMALKSIVAFICFCLVTSGIYLFNDIVDLEEDKHHPMKSKRPLARGSVAPRLAGFVSLFLALLGVLCSLWLSIDFVVILLVYLLLFIAYSFLLKHVVIIDVFTIAFGFVLRAAAGAYVLNLTISPWLLICTILLALFLGLGKRRHELLVLKGNAQKHRKILNEYSEGLLDQMISVVSSATVVAYSLYTFTSPTSEKKHGLMLTIPFVLFGIFRYLYLMHKKNLGGNPEAVLLSDVWLASDIVLWGVLSALLLSWNW